MIKCLGLCLTWGGCVLWGVQAGRALRCRVRVLEDITLGLEQLRRELALTQSALPELLERVGCQRSTRQGRTLFRKCCTLLEKGKNFIDAWEEALETVELEKSERTLMEGIAQILGRYDVDQQAQALARICEELGDLERRARETMREKCRVYGALGVAVGGFAVLTLI